MIPLGGVTTPLSDKITRLVADPSDANWNAFFNALVDADLGVVVHGVPEGVSGTIQAASDELGLGSTQHEGKALLLTCADFDDFRERFPEREFNAEMDAPSVFRTALSDTACEGILVASAASVHSVPISRDQLGELMARRAKD